MEVSPQIANDETYHIMHYKRTYTTRVKYENKWEGDQHK